MQSSPQRARLGAIRMRARASQAHLRAGGPSSAPPRAREVPRGCRSPASRGGSFVPWFFWSQSAVQAFGSPEPGLLALSGAHPGSKRVHKISRCVPAQQEWHSLFPFPLLLEFLNPRARQAGIRDSLSTSGSCAQTPASRRAPHSSLFGDTARSVREVESRSLSPPSTPSVPRARTAHFACRVRSSPFAPPQDSPALGELGQSTGAVLGTAGRDFSRLLHSEGASTLGRTALFFAGLSEWVF
ncbi:uncharacterized protein LOC118993755 [Sturnira hondurensis]|uniref:uncharacterized protein LOC118993755 n=1 Tax=Sturnira hondurensis TaxID=192404 RepID=UPI00187A8CCC|nr:uncharacterized protein LOC118993755 [Sturnira hondurensis]